MASARKLGWKAWLLQEWALLLLAATLAVIVWTITSAKVLKERTIAGVRFELYVAPEDAARVGAVLKTEGQIGTVKLFGSERARNAVVAALCRGHDGQPVLRLHVSPQVGSNRARRPLNDALDKWMWPVDNGQELKLTAALPEGRVYRLDRRRQGEILLPPLTASTREVAQKKGIEIQMSLSRASAEYLAPAEILTGVPTPGITATGKPFRMEPDPLDLSSQVGRDHVKLTAGGPYTLSFNRWRDALDVPTDLQGYAANYRHRLPVPEVQVTVTLRQVEELGPDDTINQVVVMLDERMEAQLDPQNVDGLLTTGRFGGTLVGPADLLEEVRTHPEEWTWVVWVDKPKEGWPGKPEDGWLHTTGTLAWVPQRASWRGQGIHLKLTAGQRNFRMQVRLRPK
jgi:hypothetical protein